MHTALYRSQTLVPSRWKAGARPRQGGRAPTVPAL